MLEADPSARASLDEVLNHPWMKPRPDVPSAGADVPTLAELRWPGQANRKRFYEVAALESRNGDDAWEGLADALGLVSRLCEEARSGRDAQGHFPKLASASNVGQLLRFLDRAWSLLAKIRSRTVLDWPTLVPRGPFETPTKCLED